ncbi:MAG: hypothetical protein OXC48_08200 [Endozoicomonadaceae bacterium]|nr:hypothetical protein [Endozoicomonadaceae bacterium]
MHKKNLIHYLCLAFLATILTLNVNAKKTRDNKVDFNDFTYMFNKNKKDRPIKFTSLKHCIKDQPYDLNDGDEISSHNDGPTTTLTIKAGRHNDKDNLSCIHNSMLSKQDARNHLVGAILYNVNFAFQGSLTFEGLDASDNSVTFNDIILSQVHVLKIHNRWTFGGPHCNGFDFSACGKQCKGLDGVINCTSTTGKKWCFIGSHSNSVAYFRQPCSVDILKKIP